MKNEMQGSKLSLKKRIEKIENQMTTPIQYNKGSKKKINYQISSIDPSPLLYMDTPNETPMKI